MVGTRLTSKMQNMNQEFQSLLKRVQQPFSKLDIRSLAGAVAHYISASIPNNCRGIGYCTTSLEQLDCQFLAHCVPPSRSHETNQNEPP